MIAYWGGIKALIIITQPLVSRDSSFLSIHKKTAVMWLGSSQLLEVGYSLGACPKVKGSCSLDDPSELHRHMATARRRFQGSKIVDDDRLIGDLRDFDIGKHLIKQGRRVIGADEE